MDNKLKLVVQFTAIDKLSGGLKNIIGLGRSTNSQIKELAAKMAIARDKVKSLQTQIHIAMREGKGDLTVLATEMRQFETAAMQANAALVKQKRLLAIDGKVGKMQAAGQAHQSAGMNSMMAGGAMALPAIMAVKSGMDFSSGMVDIQQKANLTNAEADKMAVTILKLARAAHQLPESMRSGLDVLASAGLDPRTGIKMIQPIGRFSTAYKTPMTDVANASYANFNNLKVPVSETARALDIMAVAGKAGNFEVSAMAANFPALTARLQMLRQSGLPAVADLAAALEVSRDAAGNDDEAANNIANLLDKINSQATIQKFQKSFGVDLPAAIKKGVAAGQSPMEALALITQKATGGNLDKLGWAFEDRQAKMGLAALILNLEKYKKIRAGALAGGGSTSTDFAQREQRDGNVPVTSAMGELSSTGVILGTQFLPMASDFLGMVNSILSAIGNWSQAHPALSKGLMQLAATGVMAKIGLGALRYSFGTLLGPAAKIWGVFQKWRTIGSIAAVFPRVAKVFGILRTAAMFLGKGMLRAGAMMLANPMWLAIAVIGVAIGVCAYLVYKNWDKIKAAFFTGLAWVKNTLKTAKAWFSNIGHMMMDGLMLALNPMLLAQRLIAIAKGGIAAFKNFFGIKSPSLMMMQMGGHLATGLGMGIDRHAHHPIRSVTKMAAGVGAAGALALSGAGSAGPAFAASGAGHGARGGPAKTEIHIHQQAGENVDALVDRLERMIDARQRRKRLSSYQDDF